MNLITADGYQVKQSESIHYDADMKAWITEGEWFSDWDGTAYLLSEKPGMARPEN